MAVAVMMASGRSMPAMSRAFKEVSNEAFINFPILRDSNTLTYVFSSFRSSSVFTSTRDNSLRAMLEWMAGRLTIGTWALNNNEVEELWKTGSATLVSSGIGSFTGIIRVKGGILQVAAQDGLGTTAGATYVESGATLEQTSNNLQFSEPMFLEGTGVDEKGAYFASDNTTYRSRGL